MGYHTGCIGTAATGMATDMATGLATGIMGVKIGPLGVCL